MKRQTLYTVLFFFLFSIPSTILAQTVTEIISKHIIAHGGIEKWENVNVLKITGKFTAFSIEKDFTSYKSNCGAYYSDRFVGEQHIIEAFDGKDGWIIDPWHEMDQAHKISPEEKNMSVQKSDFFSPFYNYMEKGHKVKLIGNEQLDGIEVIVLELTRNNGKIEKWYLNAKTYLEYKYEAEWLDFSKSIPSEVYFSDFRNVDGLILPFYTERIFGQRDRITEIEKIEINPNFDTNLLKMPKRKEMAKLAFMEGDWIVEIEEVDANGEYDKPYIRETLITYAATNLLQATMTHENKNKSINYSYNPENGNYRIICFNEITSSIDIFQGKMQDSILVAEDTNIDFGNETPGTRTYIQKTVTKINYNKFLVEHKISKDKGTTWLPETRFTYIRKVKK